MKLTSGAKIIIEKLNSYGYEAYTVGGYVRDFLLGKNGGDVDITTSATPEQMLEVFSDFKVYLTGLKHGTITVNADGEMIEVTTYRVDGNYLDNRHPTSVKFVKSLSEDLKRRDFTINAMAYDGNNLVDLFGGQEDLKNNLIKAVGDPDVRFREDALRILRALRFSSVLDFDIEKNTALAIKRNAHLLKNVSVERIFTEFNKMLLGKGVERVFMNFKEVIFEVIPELKAGDGLSQKSKFHAFDVYEHIVKSVALSKPLKTSRWALLFHDVDKPSCYSEDEEGVGHFFGHQQKSANMAVKILKRLKADNNLISDCYSLIYLHDHKTELTRGEVKKLLYKYGVSIIEKLIEVKIGDALAHAAPYDQIRMDAIFEFEKTVKDIIKNGECFTLKNLKINGNDLKELGFSGKDIKQKLISLLYDVMYDKVENDREKLIERVKNDRSFRK